MKWLRMAALLTWFTIARPARALIVRARKALLKSKVS